jgi:hypothetical protein
VETAWLSPVRLSLGLLGLAYTMSSISLMPVLTSLDEVETAWLSPVTTWLGPEDTDCSEEGFKSDAIDNRERILETS